MQGSEGQAERCNTTNQEYLELAAQLVTAVILSI